MLEYTSYTGAGEERTSEIIRSEASRCLSSYIGAICQLYMRCCLDGVIDEWYYLLFPAMVIRYSSPVPCLPPLPLFRGYLSIDALDSIDSSHLVSTSHLSRPIASFDNPQISMLPLDKSHLDAVKIVRIKGFRCIICFAPFCRIAIFEFIMFSLVVSAILVSSHALVSLGMQLSVSMRPSP